jgi:hypothetical protein
MRVTSSFFQRYNFISFLLPGQKIYLPVQASNGVELYEGGRQGQKRLAEDYGEDDEDGQHRDNRDKRAKAELESVIQKQFRLRKGGAEEGRKEEEEQRILSYAKVKAAEFTAGKISGLDIKTREDYLGNILYTGGGRFFDVSYGGKLL